jgi:hypothetical protein
MICCGAQVKYFAVYLWDVAGFIQLISNPGIMRWEFCASKNPGGGPVLDEKEEEVVFVDGHWFFVSKKWIVCCAQEAGPKIGQRILASVQQTDITSSV